jgi:hypothetical protein
MSKCYDNTDYDDLGSDIQNTWNQHPKVEQKYEAKIMKNIHILPTDNKYSRLYFNINDKEFQICENEKTSTILKPNRHIYITSDEEIKERDWFLCLDNGKCNDSIYKANEAWLNMEEKQPSYCKKIILTTDQQLIADGIEQISEDTLLKIVEHINSGKNIESFNEL